MWNLGNLCSGPQKAWRNEQRLGSSGVSPIFSFYLFWTCDRHLQVLQNSVYVSSATASLWRLGEEQTNAVTHIIAQRTSFISLQFSSTIILWRSDKMDCQGWLTVLYTVLCMMCSTLGVLDGQAQDTLTSHEVTVIDDMVGRINQEGRNRP